MSVGNQHNIGNYYDELVMKRSQKSQCCKVKMNNIDNGSLIGFEPALVRPQPMRLLLH